MIGVNINLSLCTGGIFYASVAFASSFSQPEAYETAMTPAHFSMYECLEHDESSEESLTDRSSSGTCSGSEDCIVQVHFNSLSRTTNTAFDSIGIALCDLSMQAGRGRTTESTVYLARAGPLFDARIQAHSLVKRE